MPKPIPENMKIGAIHASLSCGFFEIIKYKNYLDVVVRFVKSGYEVKTTAEQIRLGKIKDPMCPNIFGLAFFGVGDYSQVTHKAIYKAWYNMLRRCYCEKTLKVNPTYIGCMVCDEWLNFQNFAKWYECNYPKDSKKYQLDKDKKIKGNKVYSPDTCLFITGAENRAIAHNKMYCFVSPDGDEFSGVNVSKLCREFGLDAGGMSKLKNGKLKSYKGWKLK